MTDYPWLAHYPEHIDWHAAIDSQPLHTILEETAARHPERAAIYFLGKEWSYAALLKAVDQAAEGFQKLGVGKGDRVALMLPNCPAFVISYFGVLKAGGTVVNFNPLYSKRETEHQLKDSGAKLIVTTNLKLIYPKVEAALTTTQLEAVILVDFAKELDTLKQWAFRLLKAGEQVFGGHKKTQHLAFDALLNNAGQPRPVTIEPETDVAVLQYTGGTTGVPKAAVLTHYNLYANTVQCGLWCAPLLEPRDSEVADRVMGVLPLFHVFAMTTIMNLGLYWGMTLVLLPKFDLKQLLKTITKVKPTVMPGVPTMYAAIMNSPDVGNYDLSSLKCGVSGGAALPLEVKTRFENVTGCTLVEGYGLTETSPVASANPFKGENKTGSIGLPFPQTIIEIRDVNNPQARMPQGEKGEVCIRGPQVMQGYWNKPGESEQVLMSVEGDQEANEKFLRTGDIGYMDEQGYVFIVDRLKEMILTGGYNVYPRHVEEALYTHEAVKEAAVVGIPDPYYGQKVKAFVVLKDGQSLEAAALREYLKGEVSKYAVPKDIEFRDELPKSMIGKILKKDLVKEEEKN